MWYWSFFMAWQQCASTEESLWNQHKTSNLYWVTHNQGSHHDKLNLMFNFLCCSSLWLLFLSLKQTMIELWENNKLEKALSFSPTKKGHSAFSNGHSTSCLQRKRWTKAHSLAAGIEVMCVMVLYILSPHPGKRDRWRRSRPAGAESHEDSDLQISVLPRCHQGPWHGGAGRGAHLLLQRRRLQSVGGHHEVRNNLFLRVVYRRQWCIVCAFEGEKQSCGNIVYLVCQWEWVTEFQRGREKLQNFPFPLRVTAVLFSFWQFCVWCGVYLLHQRWGGSGRWGNPGLC